MTEESSYENGDSVDQKPDIAGDVGVSLATTKINSKIDIVGNGCIRKSNQTTTKCAKNPKFNSKLTTCSKNVNEESKMVTLTTETPVQLCQCTSPSNCVSLKDILNLFKVALSEEQAWALIFQYVLFYRKYAAAKGRHIFSKREMPDSMEHLNLHHDGTVHCTLPEAQRNINDVRNVSRAQSLHEDGAEDQGYENYALMTSSHKVLLRKVAVIVYTALDYNMPTDEQCQMSNELEELISHMTEDESDEDRFDDDEGIDQDYRYWDDNEKIIETKEFDYVLKICKNHIKPTVPEDHYKAVCRALATETIELRVFLQHVLSDDNVNLKAQTEKSKQELAKLGFNDWARFWVSCIDELRRGVRLKKSNYSRAPTEFELTPYEILMEDIRSKNYQLRKVMVNGEIPPRVKKDAQALILEFIRSRPPLKKASERVLPPPIKRAPSPRDQLMDSIRKGQTLRHIQSPPKRLLPIIKDRLLPASTASTKLPSLSSNLASTTSKSRHTLGALTLQENMEAQTTTTRSKQRLIKVDFSLLQDDDALFDGTIKVQHAANHPGSMGICSQPKMPPYPIGGYMVGDACTTNPAAVMTTRVVQRATYDLATQCESRRASMRRHTIVGCQSNLDETHSVPTSRPASRQSTDVNVNSIDVCTPKKLNNNLNHHQQQQQQLQIKSVDRANNRAASNANEPWNKSFLDEKTWHERGDDRLSLTLEEIVHIRSVMTKAELEGLPVDVRIKEDVEKRKVCFLCLRTRFSIFGPWGIPCKLCQRTVCSKCYTKMRLPSEHFRKVPLVLISPSLLSSPASSNASSPSHHAHHAHSSSTGNILDETFPKSLIERLLLSETETRNTVGSAPSSPKHQRSNRSTPGAGQTVEGVHEVAATISNSYYKATAHNKQISNMSRSMEGPQSLPTQVISPARPHSNSSTLDRKSKFARAFMLSSSSTHLSQEQKENMRGEQVPVCHDCKGLVMEITRSSKQTRSSARNRALQSLTLDLSPVYKL